MSTVRQVATRAGRFLGLTSEARPTLVAYDAQVLLEGFQSLLTQYVAQGTFGDLADVLVEEDYEAGENERLTLTSPTWVITYPTVITENGVDRPVKDRSVVQIAGGNTSIYDADLGVWTVIQTLTLASDAPLSVGMGAGLSALLAVSMAGDFGAEISEATLSLAQAGAQSIRAARRINTTIDAGLNAAVIGGSFNILTGV